MADDAKGPLAYPADTSTAFGPDAVKGGMASFVGAQIQVEFVVGRYLRAQMRRRLSVGVQRVVGQWVPCLPRHSPQSWLLKDHLKEKSQTVL